MSNINTLLQLFGELSKEEKQKFLVSLSVKVPQVSTVVTSETKEEYLRKLCKIRNFSQSPFGGLISEESGENFLSGRN